MAAARVAAGLGEDRHDLVGEVDRQVDVAALGRDAGLDPLVAVDRRDLGRAVGERQDAARGGDLDNFRVGDVVLDVLGQVLRAAVLQRRRDNELLRRIGAFEANRRRVCAEGLHLARLGQRRQVGLVHLLADRCGAGGEQRERPEDGAPCADYVHRMAPRGHGKSA